MPRRIPPPDYINPSVVMYGVGISTTPQPGTDDYREYLRRLLESVREQSPTWTVETTTPGRDTELPAPPIKCALCETMALDASSPTHPSLLLIANGTLTRSAFRLGSFCAGCAEKVLSLLMDAGLLSREAPRVEQALDMVQHPYCSKHGTQRPCTQCKELL